MLFWVTLFVSQVFYSAPTQEPQDIPIYVLGTWEIPYASDIQDIAQEYDHIAIRSNGDGKIYLADPYDCSYEGEIQLPGSALNGFGIACDYWSPEYYVNSGSDSWIYYSDGSGIWDSIPNPAGSYGAGMDFDLMGSNELYEASAFSPYQFYCINEGQSYGLPGINGEISGFMTHDIMTVGSYPPGALVVTTRYSHEFFFYVEDTPDYYLYGQEDCPIQVEESLGLLWFMEHMTVYWSYKGTDGKYYISELSIPIFGGIEDETASIFPHEFTISLSPNPFIDILTVHVSESSASPELQIHDISGRPVRTLHDAEGSLFLWDGCDNDGNPLPAGMYLVLAKTQDSFATLKVVKLN